METYKYCCLNDDCDNNSFQLIKKPEKEKDQEEFCESCGCPIKLMGVVILGNIGGKFAGATPSERKKMLLKRSRQHFARSGLADRKRAMERVMRNDIKENFSK